MALTEDVYNAVERYFSTLSHTGYMSYNRVEKLLIYTFIEEMLNGSMAEYITEDDYNTIMNSLYCIYGTSCTIPYPNYKKAISYTDSEDSTLRRMESPELKNTEDSIFRSKA